MRITDIEIKNFRAFPTTYKIGLSKSGKNLLVYGENGSGKSSLYFALKSFLESGVDVDNKETEFETHQNIFIGDPGHIKLSLRENRWAKENTYEWSQDVREETTDKLITEASKSKGFLDYKDLLGTHYLHRENEAVNLFDLLVKTLLPNTISPRTNRSLGEDWDAIQPPFPPEDEKDQIETLEEQIDVFNEELLIRLAELGPKASEILRKFGYNITIDLDFQRVRYNPDEKTLNNQNLLLKVGFFDEEIPSHHNFLNEAKLSAIAIAIYLSSISLQPDSELKVLALDDVLIGLDMSNRLPFLDILREYFPDHQIFLTTYDKTWSEIVKQRTEEKDWKYIEFYFGETAECEIPVYAEDKKYLEKAKEYLEANDYKACAVYARTAFEAIIKKFCDRRRLPVRYRENSKQLTSKDFWEPIKNGQFLEHLLITQVELYRSIILNPLNHAIIANIPKREIEETIEAVEDLEAALADAKEENHARIE